MTWKYAYTPAVWPLIVPVLIQLALSAYSLRRRSVPGSLPFAIAVLLFVGWSAGSILETAASDAATAIFWEKFQGALQLPAVTGLACFVLEYAWPGRWLTRRNLALLSIAPLLVLGLMLTNDFHHLIWLGFFWNGKVIPVQGPANWLFFVYSFFIMAINLTVLGWLFLHSPQNRWPVGFIAAGHILSRTIYVLERVNVFHSDMPLEVLGITSLFILYAIALFGFRIFDPISLARQVAIQQLQSGVIVLDPLGRVTSLNPAAQAMLARPEKLARDRPIRELLPCYPDLHAGEASETEISQTRGSETHYYQLASSDLTDFRGITVGRLLMLHDVTDGKLAQAQILEQQRVLATLKERERLARELHDSIGQVLGYAGFQLDAIHDRILDGQAAISAGQAAAANPMDSNLVAAKLADASCQLDKAGSQLIRMRNIVEEAHADLREYILNLHLTPGEERPFFTTLQHYLDGYSTNYGIQAELVLGAGIEERLLDPDTQMQLFRIIQEALSNARKHARAGCVQVTFEKQEGLVRTSIQDNGLGFDPAQVAGEQAAQGTESHFGLRFMRERVEQMGGSLQVQSRLGAGTRVIVDVPVKAEPQEEIR